MLIRQEIRIQGTSDKTNKQFRIINQGNNLSNNNNTQKTI